MEINRNVESGALTVEIIKGVFVYGNIIIVLYIVFRAFILENIGNNSFIVKSIISIIVQGITIFLIWRAGIEFAANRVRIDRKDVNDVIRNLVIITGVFSFIIVSINLVKLDENFNKKMNANQFMDNFYENSNTIYNGEQKKQLENFVQEEIDKNKIQVFTQYTVFHIIELIVNLTAVILQKRRLVERAF